MTLSNIIVKAGQNYQSFSGKSADMEGPLQSFQGNIVSVKVRDRLAYLSFQFMKRDIKAGLIIKKNK